MTGPAEVTGDRFLTRLDLEHSGFDLESPMGRQAHRGTGDGWPAVLDRIDGALDGGAAR